MLNLHPDTLIRTVENIREGEVPDLAHVTLLLVQADDVDGPLAASLSVGSNYEALATLEPSATKTVGHSPRESRRAPDWHALLAKPHFGVVMVKRSSSLKDPRTLIGRGPDCDIVLNHPSVSAHHAWMDRDSYGDQLVWDAGSKNGTRMNGVPVGSKHPIRAVPGDRISFGDVVAAQCPLPVLWQLLRDAR